jgi:uncharacterized metal-binding protein
MLLRHSGAARGAGVLVCDGCAQQQMTQCLDEKYLPGGMAVATEVHPSNKGRDTPFEGGGITG